MQRRRKEGACIDYIDQYEMAGYYTQTNDALALQMSGANPANKQLSRIRAELETGMGLVAVFLGLVAVDIYRWLFFFSISFYFWVE